MRILLLLSLLALTTCQSTVHSADPKRQGIAPIKTLLPVKGRSGSRILKERPATIKEIRAQIDLFIREYKKTSEMIHNVDYYTQQKALKYAKSKQLLIQLRDPKKKPKGKLF